MQQPGFRPKDFALSDILISRRLSDVPFLDPFCDVILRGAWTTGFKFESPCMRKFSLIILSPVKFNEICCLLSVLSMRLSNSFFFFRDIFRLDCDQSNWLTWYIKHNKI